MATGFCCASARFPEKRWRFPKALSIRHSIAWKATISSPLNGVSENNRRAKYYTLTAAGRRRLREETAGWNRLASAMTAALNATPEEV